MIFKLESVPEPADKEPKKQTLTQMLEEALAGGSIKKGEDEQQLRSEMTHKRLGKQWRGEDKPKPGTHASHSHDAITAKEVADDERRDGTHD